MHFLILTHYWPPEIGASSHLTYELGETLVELGNRVTVVTGMPSYNMGTQIPERYHRRFTYEEEMGGMRVLRVATGTHHSRSRFRRGLEHLAVTPLYAWRSFGVRDVDAVYTVSPPLTMGVAAWLAAKRHRTKCCVGVQDLFPRSPIDLGLMKNTLVIRAFEALERIVYRAAGAITVHSDGNRDHILTKGIAAGKVHSIPNWVDTELIRPGERDNAFRAETGIGEREFVVLFAGTMGWSQGLDAVIRAARLLKDDPDVTFLMVGDGAERQKLGEMAADLPRVRFMPMQPQERYSQVLAASDACLVTLRPEVATPVVPSKLLTIMAAALPVLASLPLTGDAPKIITDAHAGIVSPAGDEVSLADGVRLLKRDPQRASAFGQAGRKYAIRCFSRPACVRRFEQVLRQISKTPPSAATAPSSSSPRSSYELPTTLPK